MNSSRERDDSAVRNERSLKRLVRSLSLSGGQFSLILACCNYESLQNKILARLRQQSSIKIQELLIPQQVNTLYTTIKSSLDKFPQTPSALTIFGLDRVANLDELLLSTNQVRDEFRKSFNFPIVLWVTDEVVAKLIKLAPDFKSWAAATIKFELLKDELIELLQQNKEEFFQEFYGSDRHIFNSSSSETNYSYPVLQLPILANNLCKNRRNEIEQALKDLGSSKEELDPILQTDLEFILGWDDCVLGKLNNALAHYQKSLNFWQQEAEKIEGTLQLKKQGIILYYMALCYRLKATSNSRKNREEWEKSYELLDRKSTRLNSSHT